MSYLVQNTALHPQFDSYFFVTLYYKRVVISSQYFLFLSRYMSNHTILIFSLVTGE